MKLSVKVHCGDAVFGKNYRLRLEDENLELCPDARFQLLVDRPLGWASLDHGALDYENCIIMSDNLCPAYQLDLLEREPAALIHLADGDVLLPTLQEVQAGNTVHPRVKTVLTRVERTTLRLTAQGYSNKEIAELRNVGEGTVKNCLADIYKKLNLRSRVQSVHYYYGSWHLIGNWEAPHHD